MIPDDAMTSYADLVTQTIAKADVPQVLSSSPRGAVVLERVARGAGATNWFTVRTPQDLIGVASAFSPGSAVSFYFDERFHWHAYDGTIATEILAIAERDGDAVVGRLAADGISVEVEYVASETELNEFVMTLRSGEEVLVGAFPARDNDGERAITVDLPDRDGIVRAHPH
jgi:hypothetical protein